MGVMRVSRGAWRAGWMTGLLACGPLVPAAGDGGSDSSSGGGEVETGDPSDTDTPVDPSVPGTTIGSSGDPTVGSGPDTTTSGGSDPVCGDGLVEGDEQCDDGNVDDGDTCTSQCTSVVEVQWSYSHDGLASSFDEATDVVLAPDGSIWVLGSTRTIAASSDVWLQQLSPDGVPLLTFTYDGPEGLDDHGTALAWTPDGHLAIAGSSESSATRDDILVLRVDPATAQLVWVQTFDGPDAGNGRYDDTDVANGITATATGALAVAGTIRIGDGDYDAWLAQLDATTGALQWVRIIAGPAGGRDDGRDVLADAAGGVVLLMTEDDDHGSSLRQFDASGLGVSSIPIEGAMVAAAWRSDAGIVTTGAGAPEEGDIVVQALQPSGVTDWRVSYGNGGFTDDAGVGVAVGPGDAVIVVGSIGTGGQQDNAFIGGYDNQGHLDWIDAYDGPASLNDSFAAVAVLPDGGAIAVGQQTELGQQTNALVRRYLAP